MSYVAITSTNPPNKGTAKFLYSPSLFDATTGVYNGHRVNGHTYPMQNGKIVFYEGSMNSITSFGSVQVSLTNPPSTTYWEGEFQILNASDRSVVVSGQVMKGSQYYIYIPAYVPPYYREISEIRYIANIQDGLEDGNQRYPLADGNYIAVFQIVRKYMMTVAGPPMTFSETDVTSVSTMEHNFTISTGVITSVSFTL